jgi:hypothetical protein
LKVSINHRFPPSEQGIGSIPNKHIVFFGPTGRKWAVFLQDFLQLKIGYLGLFDKQGLSPKHKTQQFANNETYLFFSFMFRAFVLLF